MEAASGQAESDDGARSREPSKELLRDEQAWSENSQVCQQPAGV
jgi:hypothetical protein